VSSDLNVVATRSFVFFSGFLYIVTAAWTVYTLYALSLKLSRLHFMSRVTKSKFLN